jgi:segregation and condensation protein A
VVEAGARLAIRLLQEAALRGELDPWDVDVIAVVDGFLDQLRQRIEMPRLVPAGGSRFEQDLADSSEAFLAASVLVGLKAEVLEAATFPVDPLPEQDGFSEVAEEPYPSGVIQLPRRPELHLQRRPVAPPPLQRPVTLGELIAQLEDIAERLERGEGEERQRRRGRRYSERAAIAQVAGLAHRERLPETTVALSRFLQRWERTGSSVWVNFEDLVTAWAGCAPRGPEEEDLDRDRVGVFWALLFLCSQGAVELDQAEGLFGPLRLRRLQEGGESHSLQHLSGEGSARGPARDLLAA